MEIVGGIIAVILVAILISALFYYGFNARGPWGSFWTFLLALLLIVWAASIWVRPLGPVYWGVAWIPLIFIGFIFALLLAAVPTYDTRTRTEARADIPADEAELEARSEADAAAVAVGWIFWTFIIILLVAIIIGYATADVYTVETVGETVGAYLPASSVGLSFVSGAAGAFFG